MIVDDDECYVCEAASKAGNKEQMMSLYFEAASLDLCFVVACLLLTSAP